MFQTTPCSGPALVWLRRNRALKIGRPGGVLSCVKLHRSQRRVKLFQTTPGPAQSSELHRTPACSPPLALVPDRSRACCVFRQGHRSPTGLTPRGNGIPRPSRRALPSGMGRWCSRWALGCERCNRTTTRRGSSRQTRAPFFEVRQHHRRSLSYVSASSDRCGCSCLPVTSAHTSSTRRTSDAPSGAPPRRRTCSVERAPSCPCSPRGFAPYLAPGLLFITSHPRELTMCVCVHRF